MPKTDLDKKIFMAQSFLDSAIFLEKTQDFLPADLFNSPEDARAKFDNPLPRKVVIHFSYAVVFELSIKIIWEIEQGKEAPHHHNISLLYKKLSPVSKQKISDLYAVQVSNMKKLISECNGRKNRSGQIVNLNPDFQSLQEALEVNQQTVKNFKYDGQFKEKSSVLCSIMWTDDLIYVLPKLISDAIVFPKCLLEYAISLKS